MKVDREHFKFGAAMLLAVGVIFLAGCFGRRHQVSNFEFNHEMQAAKIPLFMVGPAAALLTNANGYSARLTIEQPGVSNTVTTTGQLLVREQHMLFTAKNSDSTFLWDVKEETGFVLSEALQGYAPIASPTHVTRVQMMSQTAGAPGEVVNGHPGHEVEVAVTCDDGTTTTFAVWQASDVNAFPVRIRTVKSPVMFTLDLMAMRSEDLERKLFLPPEGFTKYASADSMVGELFARKSKSKISSGSDRKIDPKSGNNYSY
ncbi:MAG TPA: hypothetical protein VH413_20770 [Verrucomicrobiae bacterium]|jgi:hypothetical protein|nr:hypothetical protein [Verrucomicrobiae bacterium]